MEYECPYCGAELVYHDSYGYFAIHQSGKKLGEIYKCYNEVCDSACFNFIFHTKPNREELHEGHPC